MPAITAPPGPGAWDVDADWWGPGWAVVTAVGPAEPARPGMPSGVAAEQAVPVPPVSCAADTRPSWRQVLTTTVALWAARRPSRARPLRLLSAAMLTAGLLAAGAGAAGLAVAHASSAPSARLPAAPSLVAAPSGPAIAPASEPAAQQVPLSGARPASRAAAPAPPRPVWLTIPAIGVKAPVITLGLNRDGTLQVPGSTTVAGWYTGSPRPGATGSAVIAGHVDSRSGPGVFFWLRSMHRGDRIYVRRADGTLAVFTVTAVQMYAKSRFPTAAVYGPVPDAELRLITCGGTFDYARGSYLSNVVVYARLTA
jgi:sortase (surface protein transpeptidase)